MAVLAACATGNFTNAATWALVDSTSYLGAETGSDTLGTTYATTRSSAFTPGAIEIDGVGVKLNNRTGTTGTFSVHLELDSDDSEVAGTEVTINCSDFPAATTAALDGGWIFFKFAAPVTLPAGAIQIAAKTSSASQIALWRDGTTDNMSRYLRRTSTQAPAAGDDLIIAGEWTAAGAVTARTVTMDNTATTDFGSAPTAANSLLTPGLAICNNGTLTWGATAATNYYLKQSNSVICYRVGVINFGTTGTPFPRDTTAVWELDPAADGDYGWLTRGGTFNGQGLSRTSGKNIVSCKLNTDEAMNQTTLGVDTDTGWLDNDEIAIASTSRTATEGEFNRLNGAAGASSLTVDGGGGAGGGVANAHSGTSPTQAEVILLTRNARMRATTSTAPAYFTANADATVDLDWVEFYYIGDSSTPKRGVEAATVGGSFNMQFCSIHDCEDNGFAISGTAANNITFSNNVMWNLATLAGPACQIASATSGTSITIDSNILIRTTSGNGWTLNDVGGTFTNNTVAGAAATGMQFSEAGVLGAFTGNVSHSNTGTNFAFNSAGLSGVFASPTGWRSVAAGLTISAAVDIKITSPVLFGNTVSNISIGVAGATLHITAPVLNGDTTFATTNGIRQTAEGISNIIIDDGDFSAVAGIKTAHTNDIILAASSYIDLHAILRNTKLGAAAEISSQTLLANTGFISSQKHDQTAGNHKTWLRYGNLQTDSTTFNTAAPSLLMTPNNASGKLESASQFRGFKVAVLSGAAVTPTVQVRKSATYNGNEPRLIVKANPALGIAADAVLDTMTAAVSTWEELTGTTATVSDDGELEFVIDCDGTVGGVNVDDWTQGGTDDVRGLKYWFNGLPAEWIPPTPGAGGGGGLRIAGRGGLAAGA